MLKPWQLSRIGKRYHFSAAHMLPKVAEHHPCRRMHGHNYMVDLELRGEIAPKDGFCGNIDFFQLDEKMRPILEALDHRTLNDVPGLENPTAELIAQWILEHFRPAILWSVTVWETPECWATAINSAGLFAKEHRE